jgi:hypothetical protein
VAAGEGGPETSGANTEKATDAGPAEEAGEAGDGNENGIDSLLGNLPGAVVMDADRKLFGVLGDHVHQNDGTHLDGGIADDGKW